MKKNKKIIATYFHVNKPNAMGYSTVWLVDEHGCQMHTEPVCTIGRGKYGHEWFAEWIEGKESIHKAGDLLEHWFTNKIYGL